MERLQPITTHRQNKVPPTPVQLRLGTVLSISAGLHLLILAVFVWLPPPSTPLHNLSGTNPAQITLQLTSPAEHLSKHLPRPAASQQPASAVPPATQPQILPTVPAFALPRTAPALPALTLNAVFEPTKTVQAMVNVAPPPTPSTQPRRTSLTQPAGVTAKQAGSSGRVIAARPTKQRAPVYPRHARKNGYEGISIFIVTIQRDGNIKSLKLTKTSGHPILDRAAESALRKWKFTPATRNGTPITSQLRIPIVFRLG